VQGGACRLFAVKKFGGPVVRLFDGRLKLGIYKNQRETWKMTGA